MWGGKIGRGWSSQSEVGAIACASKYKRRSIGNFKRTDTGIQAVKPLRLVRYTATCEYVSRVRSSFGLRGDEYTFME